MFESVFHQTKGSFRASGPIENINAGLGDNESSRGALSDDTIIFWGKMHFSNI
jgi:hypothetical protein